MVSTLVENSKFFCVLVVVDKQNNKGYYCIDVTIPGDTYMKMKTTEKLDKYYDLHNSCGIC